MDSTSAAVRLAWQTTTDVVRPLPAREAPQASLLGQGRGGALIGVDLDDLAYEEADDEETRDSVVRSMLARVAEAIGDDGRVVRGENDRLVVITFGGISEALELGNRIHRAVESPIFVEGVSRRFGAAVGVVVDQAAARTPEALLRELGIALRAAKGKGPGATCVYSEGLGRKALEEVALRGALREELAGPPPRLEMQPVFEVQTNKVVAVDVSARWNHPVLEGVALAELFGVADRAHLTGELGRRVLDQALLAVPEIDATVGNPVRIVVEVNARELAMPDYSSAVIGAMQRGGVDPHRVVVSLRAPLAPDDRLPVVRSLVLLRERGVGVALADFGSGLSSLRVLRELDLDYVTLDPSFTADLDTREGTAMVKTLVTLAHSLGLRLMATGVGTPEDLAALRRLRCDLAVGDHCAPAMPLPKLADWFARGDGDGSRDRHRRLFSR
jgi:EAL domain-containing protein (putative c-di-GMP-specific phosphodiesterase class I)/GGDEF domain-containing protein